MVKCYYKILGLTTKATVDEIRRSFRLLAFRFHPDRNPGDSKAVERFREAVEAYETLVDPARRHKYDRGRGIGRSADRRARAGLGREDERGGSACLKEVFEEYFGVRVSRGHMRGPAPDLRFDLQIARSALREGAAQSVEYVREVYCGDCGGRGSSIKTRKVCTSCGGTGRLEEAMCVWVGLPADCRDGARVRMTGMGDRPTLGLPAGDLVVYVQVLEGL